VAHLVSHPTGTDSNFPGGKAAGKWRWPLTSILCRDQEWWRYTSTSSYAFIAIKYGISFTFCLLTVKEIQDHVMFVKPVVFAPLMAFEP
jgi:hypothetical protein